MEAVLDIYGLPHDSNTPVLTMDEQPVQLFRETRCPIPATQRHARRVDYEYERAGIANIFMFSDPLGNRRRVSVREHKTKLDFAEEIAHMLDVDYPDADVVVLVMDNLNTHKIGSLYLYCASYSRRFILLVARRPRAL